MGRQPRTHGAQVYCTSSPGDRQLKGRGRPASAAPHGIDFRAVLDGYGNPHEWVFCDHQGNGVNCDENVPDFFRRVEKSLARSPGLCTPDPLTGRL
jgi:hypothetical protein